MAPLVSVIVPCHNAGRWIGDTLTSIERQRYAALETIVVDDGSTDDSIAVIERWGKANVIRQSQQGVSAARNRGTVAASGAFILYLDADDVLAEDTIAQRVAAIERSGADVAYSDWVRWELQPDGSFRDGEEYQRVLGDRPDVELLTDGWWPPGALLYRRSLIDRILPWRQDLPVIQDARFLLDAALAGGRFAHVPGAGLRYRVHGSTSLSRRDPQQFLRDVHRSVSDLDARWTRASAIDDLRRLALVRVYAYLARSFFTIDRATFDSVVTRLYELDPNFLPEQPQHFRALSRFVGYRAAEHIALGWRAVKPWR